MQRQLQDFSITEFTGTKKKQKEGICISSNFTRTSPSLQTESDYPLPVSKTGRLHVEISLTTKKGKTDCTYFQRCS
jgi:hypothetical protein